MVGERNDVLRCETLDGVGADAADDAYLAPPRTADGDAAHAGAGPAQQLWTDCGYGRADAESCTDDLRVRESRTVARRFGKRPGQEKASGLGREGGDRASGEQLSVNSEERAIFPSQAAEQGSPRVGMTGGRCPARCLPGYLTTRGTVRTMAVFGRGSSVRFARRESSC